MLIIPIRTQSNIRRTPTVNYSLIGINVLLFLVLDERFLGKTIATFRDQYLALHSDFPRLYQFFTYQFIHGDMWHLLGNMLFLWVFGNSVNAKMGNATYLLFYIAGGVFAAWAYATVQPEAFTLIGASGAIASITTAYLVLFPRSRVTVLIWMFFIYTPEVSAMVIILAKIVVWDNMIAPSLYGAGNVATHAHLAGYLFGFVGALGMLLIRALPRDQFDILSLWKRWNQRRQFQVAMADPHAAARAQYGSTARVAPVDPKKLAEEERRLDAMAELRSQIGTALRAGQPAQAATFYEQLLEQDTGQCLSEQDQLAVAREYYSSGQHTQAAAAFERFVECHARSVELANVQLLLGIIYARDLREFESADKYLTKTWETLRDEQRRQQCFRWLSDVRAALGRPMPET